MRRDDWRQEDETDGWEEDSPRTATNRRLSFFEFWGMLCFAPARFFRHYFNKHASPYFPLVLMIVGLAGAIDRYERALARMDARGQLAQVNWMNTWPTLWAISIPSGALSGLFFYYVGGWWYDVRVGFAGGRRDAETSRFILLYSSFIPCLLSVVNTLADSFSSPFPLTVAELSVWDKLGLLAVMAASFYSLYVSYRGVREVTGASRAGALTWFVILPAIVYFIAFGALVALLFVAAN